MHSEAEDANNAYPPVEVCRRRRGKRESPDPELQKLQLMKSNSDTHCWSKHETLAEDVIGSWAAVTELYLFDDLNCCDDEQFLLIDTKWKV
eukprot:scaffold11313_cov144-Skeletonema_marinoi.AAC.4